MQNAYVVTGTLTDDHTVALDESLPLSRARVRLVIEPLPSPPRRPYDEVLAEIRERQLARSYRPPTREEADSDLQAERASWDQ